MRKEKKVKRGKEREREGLQTKFAFMYSRLMIERMMHRTGTQAQSHWDERQAPTAFRMEIGTSSLPAAMWKTANLEEPEGRQSKSNIKKNNNNVMFIIEVATKHT